jgi:N-acylneuraminate cytidylyltransferase
MLNRKIVAFVPLRGGSKGIPKKNIIDLNGKPLCAWALSALSLAKSVDDVYVSTDSAEIENVVRNLNLDIKVIKRPDNISTDESSTESAMFHFMKCVDFDDILLVQATSPLINSNELDGAIEKYYTQKLDSLFSASVIKNFLWEEDGNFATPINYNPAERPRRQEFNGTIVENGGFYITKKNILKIYNSRLGGKIGFYETRFSIEIDEKDDLIIAESLFNSIDSDMCNT